jgi:hypothetical protein
MSEELDIVGDDLGHAALFAFLILIRAVLESSLDVERVALLDILGRRLGELVSADNRVELRLFFAFDLSVGGQAEVGDGLPVLGVAELGIASDVADQDDFVDAAHPLMIARRCKNCV